MRISERKQRLRARGAIPMPRDIGPGQGQGQPDRASPATRQTTTTAPAGSRTGRPRRQMGARYQLIFGSIYVIFAPLLFWYNLALAHAPAVKGKPHYQPGAFELLMPVIFFLFGLWWVYRGLQARKRASAAQAASTITTAKAQRLVKPVESRK